MYLKILNMNGKCFYIDAVMLKIVLIVTSKIKSSDLYQFNK